MKAFKIKETVNPLLEKGRIFCESGYNTILLATQTKPQQFFSGDTYRHLKRGDKVEEIELENEKWILPHLYKPIRKLLLKL